MSDPIVTFTAVPGGIAATKGTDVVLALSVVVTFNPPAMKEDKPGEAYVSDEDVAAYNDLMNDWPWVVQQRIESTGFAVKICSSGGCIVDLPGVKIVEEQTQQDRPSATALSSALWKRLISQVDGERETLTADNTPLCKRDHRKDRFPDQALKVASLPEYELGRGIHGYNAQVFNWHHQKALMEINPRGRERSASRAEHMREGRVCIDLLSPLQWIKQDSEGKDLPENESIMPKERGQNLAEPYVARNIHRLADHPTRDLLSEVCDLVATITHEKPLNRAMKGKEPAGLRAEDFLEAAMFHGRARAVDDDRPKPAPSSPSAAVDTPHDLDVFQRLAQVSNYPVLLMPLGLVLKLQVTISVDQARKLREACGNEDSPVWVEVDTTAIKRRSKLYTAIEFDHDFRARDRRHVSGDQINPNWTRAGFLDLRAALMAEERIRTDGPESEADTERGMFQFVEVDPHSASINLMLYAKTVAQAGLGVLISDQYKRSTGREVSDRSVDRVARKHAKYADKLGEIESTMLGGDSSLPWNKRQIEVAPSVRYQAEAFWKDKKLEAVRWHLRERAVDADLVDPDAPAMRSAGIRLIWRGRREIVTSARARAKRIQESLSGAFRVANLLYAPDLVLGFVPEVRLRCGGEFSAWHSPTFREETFQLGSDLYNGRRNGVLRLPITQTTDSAPTAAEIPQPELLTAETMFNWSGATLGVHEEDEAAELKDKHSRRLEDQTEFDQRSNSEIPVTLSALDDTEMPLRYTTHHPDEATRPYQFRMRTVNIAGDGLCTLQKGVPEVERGVDFLRYEPVSPPEPLLDEQPDYTAYPKRGLTMLVVSDHAKADRRWVIPPSISIETAERHLLMETDNIDDVGGFDDVRLLPDGAVPTVEIKNAPKREEGDTGEGDKQPIRLPVIRREKGDVPKLPDPFARELSYRLRWKPESQDAERIMSGTMPFYPGGRQWPRARAIAIKLTADDVNAPSIKSRGRTLDIRLPKGTSAKLHLSCGFGPDDFGKKSCNAMGPLVMAEKHNLSFNGRKTGAFAPEAYTEAMALAQRGFHPMLSPEVTFELVHAVKTPVDAPVISTILEDKGRDDGKPDAFSREANTKQAKMAFVCEMHAASTERLRFKGTWRQPLKDKPGFSVGQSDVGEETIEPGLGSESNVAQLIELVHELPDCGYRLIKYTVTGASRFAQHFEPDTTGTFLATSKEYAIHMLNCSEPEPPHIAYVMPTYTWKRELPTAHAAHYSHHRTSGLRVYVHGWYSTGEGEKLGLVLGDKQVPTDPTVDLDLTQWAIDPLRCGPLASSYPNEKDLRFEDGAKPETVEFNFIKKGVNVEGKAALFDPKFDESKGLWYFDIDVNPPADRAFIRLSLVRFQRHSIQDESAKDMRFSKPVPAAFVQLSGDRTLTVWREPRHSKQMHAMVTTPTPGGIGTLMKIQIYKQSGSGGWEMDTNSIVKEDLSTKFVPPISHDETTLAANTFTWRERVGPRKLAVLEQEFPADWGDADQERFVYADVLDI